MTLSDVAYAETILGRTLTPLELAICTEVTSLSLSDFLYAIEFQSLMEWLEKKLGRKLTATEAVLAARLFRKGQSRQAILLAIRGPKPKNTPKL